MSAPQLLPTTPPQGRPTTAELSAAPAPAQHTSPADRPVLRLVEDSPPGRSLAPSGPLQAWRRRLGALLVLVAVVVLAVEAFSGPVAPAPEVVPASTATVVVEPGQTLWQVAAEHAPDGVATADYVRQLAEVNGIANGELESWQVVRLPTG